MKVSPTFYSPVGELMAPDALDVKMNTAVPGGNPDLEPGFYYDFKFETVTAAERAQKRARLFEIMNAIPGFMALAVREYQVTMDTFVRYGFEMLYAIESADGADAPLAKTPPRLRRLIDGMAGAR
jgi:hypothetical protein